MAVKRMKYDKIRGKTVAECMMKLRSRYGDSAIVLSTREVREGGLLGSGIFSRRLYEMDFMVEEGRPAGTGHSSTDRPSAPAPAEPAEPRPPTFERVDRVPARSAPPREPMGSGEVFGDSSAEEILSLLRSSDSASVPPVAPEAQEIAGAGDSEHEPEPPLRQPLSQVRDSSSVEDQSPYYGSLRGRLSTAHLSPAFVDGFLAELDHSLSGREKKEFRRVEQKTLERLSEIIRTVPDIAPARGECRAVMLVGPTGAGKTTSLAKLAARYRIFQEREVSLYSLDHYRLAATEQLKTYAGVMDVPFFAPKNPEEFREQIRRDGAELMLIDTSGIGHRDRARLDDLARFAAACEVRLEKHLVLAANTDPGLLDKILLAYDALGFDKIILTKLDESDFIGAFVEHADKFNRPFSFLTNGQEVPGDILEPQPLDMAKMVLGEEQPPRGALSRA